MDRWLKAKVKIVLPCSGWVVVCLLLACQQRDQRYFGVPKPTTHHNVVQIPMASEPASFDPGLCTETAGSSVAHNLFAALYHTPHRDLRPVPDLAQEVTVSEDGLLYTFTLRPAVWSDGHPLGARDFERSYKRILDPITASRYRFALYQITGAEGFAEGGVRITLGQQPGEQEVTRGQGTPHPGLRPTLQDLIDSLQQASLQQASLQQATLQPISSAKGSLQPTNLPPLMMHQEDGGLTVLSKDANITGQVWLERLQHHFAKYPTWDVHLRLLTLDDVGVVALGEHQLQIRLRSPTPYFLRQLSHTSFRAVPMHVLDALKAKGIPQEMWIKPEWIVSSGPFVLHSHRFNWDMELRPNPRYYQAEQVKISGVRFVQIDNPYTVMNLYRNGELDWLGETGKIPIAMVDQLRHYGDVWQEPSLTMEMYAFNTLKAPFDNLHVRRAFSLAVHREALVQYITRGGEIPTSKLVPPGIPGWQDRHDPGYDPKLAQEELAKAGYGPHHPLPSIELLIHTDEKARRIAEALQAMWQTTLAADVRIRMEEWSVFLNTLHQKDFLLARHSWHADYPDANSFLSDLYHSTSENNITGVESKAIDEALQAGYFLQDEQERIEHLQAVEDLILSHQPVLPLYAGHQLSMVQPYMQGLEPNGLQYHPLAMLRFAPGEP